MSNVADFIPEFLGGLWYGYGWGTLDIMRDIEIIPPVRFSPLVQRIGEIGLGGVLFLYVAGVLTWFVFLQGVFRGREHRMYAFAGILMLVFLLFCDVFLVYSDRMVGLWLSGWVTIAVLWVRTGRKGVKKYRMYQV